MSTAQLPPQEAKKRIRQLFEYLVEYSRLKNPPRIHLKQYDWQLVLDDLPEHPGVRLCRGASDEEEFSLRVARPRRTRCPAPPAILVEWLTGEWDRYEVEVPTVLPSINWTGEDGDTHSELFAQDESRVRAWDFWSQERARWRETERPASEAEQLFHRLFSLRAILEREGERFSLSLGTGVLHWKSTEGQPIQHPLLVRRCSLAFDPEKSEFAIRLEDSSTELLTALVWDSAEVDTTGLPALLQQLREDPFDPLSSTCRAFLRGLTAGCWKNGDFLDGQKTAPTNAPVVTSEAFLLLMPRGRDFAESAQSFLQSLESYAVPSSLLQVIGLEAHSDRTAEFGPGESTQPLLFTMPSNPEQEKVARRLRRDGSVLVQGPPGTGKTHTIANLIGHLLAEGKSILVTSHTSKALRVVRDKVVPELRGLCVALLDDERAGQKQLEFAVKSLADKLTATDDRTLASEAKKLAQRRASLETMLREAEAQLESAHRSEYEDLVVGGQSTAPSDAARRLREGRGVHDWLPGPLRPGSVCPLSPQEFEELYRLQAEVSEDDEASIGWGLPNLDHLPNPLAFETYCQTLEEIDRHGAQYGLKYWSNVSAGREELRSALIVLDQLLEPLQTHESWLLECLQAGLESAETAIWRELIEKAKSAAVKAPALLALSLRREVRVSDGPRPEELLKDCDEVLARLKNRDSLPFLDTLRREYKRLSNSTSLAGQRPKTREDFRAVRAGLELQVLRQELRGLWATKVTRRGGPALPTEEPERTAAELVPTIETALAWSGDWLNLKTQLVQQGLLCDKLLSDVAPPGGPHSRILRHRQALSEPFRLTLQGRMHMLERHRIENLLNDALQLLRSSGADCARELESAVKSRSPRSYAFARQKIENLIQVTTHLERREELLRRLSEAAPGWVEALRKRIPPHAGCETPGKLEPAWNFRHWTEELDRRHQVDLDALQSRCHRLRRELQEVTALYVETLTWRFQLQRTGVNQRQALQGWLQLQSKIGKGTGKTAPLLRKAAREKMAECRGAVPVWIMPLNRVFESYRPGATVFDVVIIDEASQADITALLALALGKEVVVVGDHEQVSPSAIGERVEEVFELADKHLRGLPNRELFDGKTSVYDIAQRSFGETIRLREHFRCVPEIIAFSNSLCYDGDIQPLRERDEDLQPATVCHRVANGHRSGDENVNEAREIAALIAAAIEQPEYLEKTFGVISLVGDKQAILTEKILRERLDTVVLERRRILCGNPAQFQGDERDVVFLSMVDSPAGGGPHRLVAADTRTTRQRYNVAASRARDQMWVVHSLSPANDLKPDDIRLRLLKHAQEAGSVEDEVRRLKRRVESPFEEQVMSALVSAGYRVEPQMPVGSYRVDLVVLGSQRRVAIECDGDRFHPPEKLQDDLRRQEILERVGGLIFIRIRGSAFFLDPASEMQRVFRRLEELKVEKLGLASLKTEQQSELRNRVVERAQQLLREWSEEAPRPCVHKEPPLDAVVLEPKASGATPMTTPAHTTPTKSKPKPVWVGTSQKPKGPTFEAAAEPRTAVAKTPATPASRPTAKTSERPYLNLSTDELEAMIRSGELDGSALQSVKTELAQRDRTKAKQLLRHLDEGVPSSTPSLPSKPAPVRAEKRPYINIGIEGLEALVASQNTTRAELEKVRAELTHRSTARAKKLATALERRLSQM